MIESLPILASTSWSMVWQSTLCLAIGVMVSLVLARRPARSDGVLVAAMLATLAAPLGTLLIREHGWGMLPSPAGGAAAEALPPVVAPIERSTDALSASVAHAALDARATATANDERFLAPLPADAAGLIPVRPASLGGADSGSGNAAGWSGRVVWERGKSAWVGLPIGGLLLGGWCVLSAVAFARLAMSFWAGSRLVAGASRLDDARWNAPLLLAARELGLPGTATVWLSSKVRCPVIWCWSRRPVVLLPPSLIEGSSETAWLAICCHELAHWKRRDHVTTLMGQVLCCVLPWQPLAWWARRRHEQLSELACDEWVVASGHRPETYAAALIDLVPQRKPGLALAVMRNRAGLRGRIEHILRIEVARPRLGKRWLASLVALTLGMVSIVAVAQQRPLAAADDDAGSPAAKEKSGSGQAAGASDTAGAATANPSAEGLLRVTGKVVMPDGTPAAGATVTSIPVQDQPAGTARTDAAGRFELHDLFGRGGRLHAASADGSYQTIEWVSAHAARTVFGSPVEIKLAPAKAREVIVRAEGKPVEGAHVATSGSGALYRVSGITDPDGKVRLLIPDGMELKQLVAWHPQLGVDGVFDSPGRPKADMSQLSLRPPTVRTIKVVDSEGKPAAGVELGVDFRTKKDGWIGTKMIEAAHVRTDAGGTASLPWAPLDDVASIDVDVVGSDWKINDIDQKRTALGQTTVHAVRKESVQGRLVMPEGKSAEGVLLWAFGFGPGRTLDVFYARARRDGTFSVKVAPDHGYVAAIADLEWASDPWSGVLLTSDGEKPAEIVMEVYPATPVTIRLTRGLGHEPVAGALVEVACPPTQVKYTVRGATENGMGTLGSWVRTDADGRAKAGVGKGEMKVRLAAGNWVDERKIEITSPEPVDVEFYRPWLGDRRLSGRLMLDGKAYPAPSSLLARAWSPRGQGWPIQYEPKVNADGTFEAKFDAENLTLLFVDREKGYSGLANVGAKESALDIAMQPTASLSGTLLDADSKPLVGWTVRLRVEGFLFLAPSGPTDEAGKFLLTGIPGNLPVQLIAENASQDPDFTIYGGRRLLLPGEARVGEVVQADRASAVRPPLPLQENVAWISRSAALCRMRGLAILRGDDSPGVATLASKMVAFDDFKVVLHYLTVEVKEEGLETEAKTLKSYGWPLPAAGEVVLVVLDGDQKAIASERLAASDPTAALKLAGAFLEQHKAPTRDAVSLVAEATKIAEASGRRLWIVNGGPRCGPCFRLARWMDDQHRLLEKDYVIVKMMSGLDQNTDQVLDTLHHKASAGVPWYAITEPDGTIVVTSDGPLGNIGMPDGIEGIRYFRQMLDRTARNLTPGELDELIGSLSPKK